MWWKCLLTLTVFIYIYVSHYRYISKQQRKLDRVRGCTCKQSFWNQISPDCPLHSPQYLRYYRTVDNRISCDIIYASLGNTIPICNKCLNEIIPRGYLIQFPIETNQCHICGQIKDDCIQISERDSIRWVDNKQ